MIHLGLSAGEKDQAISAYCAKHTIRKVFMLSPKRFGVPLSVENSETFGYPEFINYGPFRRLMREIQNDVLVVVNECLRTQNRHELTYNCIRNFVRQTKHVLVFQTLPMIDDIQDFMILFDFVTRSKWKLEKFDADLVKGESQVTVESLTPAFREIAVPVDSKLKSQYAATKERLFAELGLKDPHTIPRNLYLIGGKAKSAAVRTDRRYLGRNNRLGLENLDTYAELLPGAAGDYTIFEFPHNFINFADHVSDTRQTCYDVLRADLKVDHWYFERYSRWAERIADGVAALQR